MPEPHIVHVFTFAFRGAPSSLKAEASHSSCFHHVAFRGAPSSLEAQASYWTCLAFLVGVPLQVRPSDCACLCLGWGPHVSVFMNLPERVPFQAMAPELLDTCSGNKNTHPPTPRHTFSEVGINRSLGDARAWSSSMPEQARRQYPSSEPLRL